ncbi:hypothetical protein [Litoribacillus peritrichatus]|uniref:Uncharacterized protein n=1 Tax=Litoribacillus peritrichatus TaxID=718191 RepID=A0ABP7MEE6_9GAMM
MKKKALLAGAMIAAVGVTAGTWAFFGKYDASDVMDISVKEYTTDEYPEDPAPISAYYKKYGGRSLTLTKNDETHFDFTLKPEEDDRVATVTFKNIDLELFVPKLSNWVKDDKGLEVITLVDREWNRQQVSFPPDSEHIEISGGDGFEIENMHSVHLARNCLNAGLWEVLLFTKEDGGKKLYYQGWFDFPLGHYKDVFEKINQVSYWDHWARLEHWMDPAGTQVDLEQLRTIRSERIVEVDPLLNERVIVAGEQKRKIRTFNASTNIVTWKDFMTQPDKVQFASFVPPGQYKLNQAWNNKYWQIGELDYAKMRDIAPASGKKESLQELELTFKDTETGLNNRLIISGFDVNALPQLETKDYPKGLYKPMGINVPPFYQSYEQLKEQPPYESEYFSVLLDENDEWIDHHSTSIDGPVMHLDKEDKSILHLYLLSYERHTLVRHFTINLDSNVDRSVAANTL